MMCFDACSLLLTHATCHIERVHDAVHTMRLPYAACPDELHGCPFEMPKVRGLPCRDATTNNWRCGMPALPYRHFQGRGVS